MTPVAATPGAAATTAAATATAAGTATALAAATAPAPETAPSTTETALTAEVTQDAQDNESAQGAHEPREAHEPHEAQLPSAKRNRRAPVWLAALLVVALLGLAALDGWLLASQPEPGSRTERDRALSTAKTAVPLILSYDYRRFDADVSAAKARLTGRAVTDYVQAMTTTIKPTATKVRAVVQAQTNGAGVEAVSGDGNQVTVVVFGEQKVTNTALTAPRIDLFRVRVTLDQVQGQWLVSKFDQI